MQWILKMMGIQIHNQITEIIKLLVCVHTLTDTVNDIFVNLWKFKAYHNKWVSVVAPERNQKMLRNLSNYASQDGVSNTPYWPLQILALNTLSFPNSQQMFAKQDNFLMIIETTVSNESPDWIDSSKHNLSFHINDAFNSKPTITFEPSKLKISNFS